MTFWCAMSRLKSLRRLVQRLRWLPVVLVLAFFGLSAGSAEASPIRKYQLTARATTDLRTWSSFLSGGVQLWARRSAPRITAAVRGAMAQALGSWNHSSPWVQYLLWRQGLNPARFNRYHPQMVAYLNPLPPPKTTCPCNCPCTPCKTTKPPKTVSPGNITPPGPHLPEP